MKKKVLLLQTSEKCKGIAIPCAAYKVLVTL